MIIGGMGGRSASSSRAKAGGPPPQAQPDAYPSFWLTDTFSENSTWWTSQLADGAPAPPWVFTDAGAVNPDAADHERVALIDRYVMTNFMVDLIVKLGTPKDGTDGQFGFIFGQREENGVSCDYRLALSSRDSQCRLLSRRGDQSETLATAAISFATELTDEGKGSLLFGAPISRLILRVDGSVVELGAPERRLLRYEFKNGAIPAGRFGLLTRGIRLILHQLTLASPQPLTETIAPDLPADAPAEGDQPR